MGSVNKSLLNSLATLLPEGLLATAEWLHRKGYSYQADRRPGPPLKWQHVVGSLQNLLELPVHVGL